MEMEYYLLYVVFQGVKRNQKPINICRVGSKKNQEEI